jgi:hypothetical protein
VTSNGRRPCCPRALRSPRRPTWRWSRHGSDQLRLGHSFLGLPGRGPGRMARRAPVRPSARRPRWRRRAGTESRSGAGITGSFASALATIKIGSWNWVAHSVVQPMPGCSTTGSPSRSLCVPLTMPNGSRGIAPSTRNSGCRRPPPGKARHWPLNKACLAPGVDLQVVRDTGGRRLGLQHGGRGSGHGGQSASRMGNCSKVPGAK